MAQAENTSSQDKQIKLAGEYTSAVRALDPVRETWPDKERMLQVKMANPSGSPKEARVSEGSLSTLVFERAARVMSQIPTGRIQALTKADKGKSVLMNRIWEDYVVPNANSQFDLLTKLRLWDWYSMVYGSMPMLYDWRNDDEYTGPDCWLLRPQDVLPQPGQTSPQECEWIMVSTIRNVSFLRGKEGKHGWNAKGIKEILDHIKEGTRPAVKDDGDFKSQIQEERTNLEQGTTKQIQLVTKYVRGKKGKWITFAPEFASIIVREIDNPHDSGKIPIVWKSAFPILDSIYGIGDYERGGTIQKAIDTFTNLNLAKEKLRTFPPTKVNTGGGVVLSSIRMQANAKWKMTDMSAVQPYQFGADSSNSFQTTYPFLKGALFNMMGTNDTTLTADNSLSSEYGKTPEALKQQQQRESTRDNWDRFLMEQALQELIEGMINLIPQKQEKNIDFTIFDDKIRLIADAGGEDVMEISQSAMKDVEATEDGAGVTLNENGAAQLSIPKSRIKSNYRFIIEPGTTMSKNDSEEHQRLLETLKMVMDIGPDVIQQSLQSEGKKVNIGNLIKKSIISGGISDWDEIIQDISEEEVAEQEQQQMMAQQGLTPDPNQMAQQQMQGQMPQQPMQPQVDPALEQRKAALLAQLGG